MTDYLHQLNSADRSVTSDPWRAGLGDASTVPMPRFDLQSIQYLPSPKLTPLTSTTTLLRDYMPSAHDAAMMQGRQRPGAACEDCRRRKLKCDGGRPKCSNCADSGVECTINPQRTARGPKKGYIKALRNRVALLESRLGEQQSQTQRDQSSIQDELNILSDTTPEPQPVATQPDSPDYFLRLDQRNHNLAISEPDVTQLSPLTWPSMEPPSIATTSSITGSMTSSTFSSTNTSVNITEMVQAELNQLYFDRVHPFVPILQNRRYIRWAKPNSTKTASRICLQYAMWTLTSTLSAQFQHLQEPLYQETRRMLGSLNAGCGNSQDCSDTELGQAWVLMATFESMKAYHRQAWMSAGRAFRLVQLMRLHELDQPGTTEESLIPDQDFVEKEEKRRVFWMAYFLDHLFSMRNSWPITLNEHVICTRLPAPESEFQSGQHVLGPFLSEAIMEARPTILSPFNECLILATICGRSLLCCQQNNIRAAYGGDTTTDWPDQHKWLESILSSRLLILTECYPAPTDAYDPMLLFANIMGQTTILYLCQSVLRSVIWPVERGEGNANTDTLQRALTAAGKIASLAKVLTDFHVFKIHPLMPIPLFVSVEFLYTNRSANESLKSKLNELLEVFGQLKNVNDLSQSYIHLLGLTCTSASAQINAG